MIEVKNLTKQYGDHLAVDHISFTLAGGKIYGFLGPNGAGKSTTMNMICGCLAPTEGEVYIDGVSVQDDPLTAKSAIGYLPEIPPLYTDMTPREYLSFVSEAKGVYGEDVRRDVTAAMEATGLTHMQDRLIRNLSKGYRQRVGIAEAMLGDPEIIILDEPTVGLDPAQIIEVRNLIRKLGETKTVILSSHILQEISAVCDHVLIIAGGKLVADNAIGELSAYLGAQSVLTLRVRGDRTKIEQILTATEGAGTFSARTLDSGHYEYKLDAPAFSDQTLETLFFSFGKAGIPLLSMHVAETGLEEVFLRLTEAAKNGTADIKNPLLFAAAPAPAAHKPKQKKARAKTAAKTAVPAPRTAKPKRQAHGTYTSLFSGDENEKKENR